MVANAIQPRQGEFPVGFSPVMIPGTIGECLSDDSRHDSRNLLINATRHVIYDIARAPHPISQICGPGSWRRVFYLNTTASDQSCPGDWSPSAIGCTVGTDRACRSAFSDNINTAYSKVCGRITGRQRDTTDAFHHSIAGHDTFEGNYLDGVSDTHGVHGSTFILWFFQSCMLLISKKKSSSSYI